MNPEDKTIEISREFYEKVMSLGDPNDVSCATLMAFSAILASLNPQHRNSIRSGILHVMDAIGEERFEDQEDLTNCLDESMKEFL